MRGRNQLSEEWRDRGEVNRLGSGGASVSARMRSRDGHNVRPDSLFERHPDHYTRPSDSGSKNSTPSGASTVTAIAAAIGPERR